MMELDREEERLLRSVALQNARAVLLARERAERDLSETKEALERKQIALQEETRILELLNQTGAAIASKLDLQTLVQTVTDAGRELSGAKFGAFFYNVTTAEGESLLLYTLSGAPREAFEKFGQPRATEVFASTFRGEGVVRCADILEDARYGKMAPHYGMPKGHLPVRSYLAVPVVSRSGEVIGGLFFGHPEPNVFTERSERLIVGIASQAAVAIDNARLYETAQREIAERQARERQLSLIYSNVSDIIFYLGVEGEDQFRFISINQAFVAVSGLPEKYIIGKLAHDVIPQSSLSSVLEHCRQAISEKKTVRWEQTAKYQFGTKVGIVSVTPIFDANNVCTNLVGTIHDITERKRSEEVLFRLAAVVESSNDAIISKSLDGAITTWNEGAQRMYGYAADEVLGKPITILIPPDLQHEEPAIIERFKKGERIDHYETLRVRKDGTLLDVALTASPIKDANGNIVGVSKIARDITERKRAEKELQRAKDELEHRVRERTASLQETTAQLEAFCYTIAHDLRSPLRAQQSFAQILLDDYNDVLDEDGRQFARRIIKSAERLDRLVSDLLAYSRLSRSDLKLEPVDLDKVLSDITGYLSHEIESKNAMVCMEDLFPVIGYEPTLNLVISNLLINALKFSKPGVPPVVKIWSELKGDVVRLSVQDNGIGIAPENQDRIFGVFERLHSMEKYPGTGIGLAIVHKGVERMGGRVGVESRLGQGCRFWIELPRCDQSLITSTA